MRHYFVLFFLLFAITGCSHRTPAIHSHHVGLAIKPPSYFSIANFGNIAYQNGYTPVISGVNSASLQQKKYEAELILKADTLYGKNLFNREVSHYFIPALTDCGFKITLLDPALYQIKNNKKSIFLKFLQRILYFGNAPQIHYTAIETSDKVDYVLILNADWGYNTFSNSYPVPPAPFRPAVYLQATLLTPDSVNQGSFTQIVTGYETNTPYTFANETMIIEKAESAVKGVLLYNYEAMVLLAEQICASAEN